MTQGEGTLHTRLYPARGELAKVGQVWIIESLADDERHTGRAIREHLLDLFAARNLPLKVTFRAVTSATELLACLDELRSDVERTRRYPILDIECHGLNDFSGLCLGDHSVVLWETLKRPLQAINLASRFNLFLIMACCNGGYFGQTARLEEMSAVCAYLGPNADISGKSLLHALSAFYTQLFTVFDAIVAIDSLRAAEPNFPYFYTTAEGLFRLGGEGYLRDCANGKALRERARLLIERLRFAGNRQVPSINEMVRTLRGFERPHFERCRRAYFALDVIPENERRYKVTYDDLVRGASRRRPSQSARSSGFPEDK
jgi:hypothetical protein